MKDWKEILNTLAGKLTAGLAFAIILVFLISLYGEEIPAHYESFIYIIIGVSYLGYFLLEIFRVQQKSSSKKENIIEIEGDVEKSIISTGKNNAVNYRDNSVEIAGNLEKGVLATGDNLQINYFDKYHSQVSKKELHKQIDKYLAWAEEYFGSITLRGIEKGGKPAVVLPLEDVYVSLRAEYNAEKNEENSFKMQREEKGKEEVSLDEVLSLSSRLIITGGPGSGKTTVLQHIAWSLARTFLKKDEKIAKEKLGLNPPIPLPIYAPLSLYASYLRDLPNGERRKKTIVAFLAEHLLQSQTGLNIDAKFIDNLLDEGEHVLLLLDGLDEIPDEDERGEIRQDIEQLAAGKEKLRIVVTSRTTAYQGQSVLGRGFQHLSVLPIDEKQIASMIEQAYKAIFPNSLPKAKKKASELIKGIKKLEADRRERLADEAQTLVSSPLMVRMFLIVHFNNRNLPEQRADLYEKAIEAMLSSDYTLDEDVSRDIRNRIGVKLSREMLALLAFRMHQRGQEQGREIEEDALKKILNNEPSYAPFVRQLLSQTRQRGTLLEERDGEYRFIHLSFQEFLVGRYLVEEWVDTERIAKFLEDGPVHESWWREPILLMLGYLDIEKRKQSRKMLHRLGGLDENGLEQKKSLSLERQLEAFELTINAHLEFQHRAEDISEKLKNTGLFFFQKETQTRANFAPDILASTANALDSLGYRPKTQYQFIHIPMSSSPSSALVAVPGGGFYMGKYLVTNEEYARFLNADDFAEEKFWVNFPKFPEPKEGVIEEIGVWKEEGYEWLKNNLNEYKKVLPRYWDDLRFGINRPSAPVNGISWYEANAYCKWLLTYWEALPEAEANPDLKPRLIRLPIENEWVFAAGGEENRRYAWGVLEDGLLEEKEEVTRYANTRESGLNRTTPVWMYSAGESLPYHLMDMSGNLWEWQANPYADSYRSRVLRGGSFFNDLDGARCAYRLNFTPDGHNYGIGLRICVSPVS